MLHVGTDTVERESTEGKSAAEIENLLLLGGEYDESRQQIVKRTPAWLVCIAFLILGLSYSIVNHTQSMRMFGSRTEWDLKMSVVVSGVLMIGTTFTNLMMGVIGRGLYPETSAMPLETALQARDSIYPLLVRDLTPWGLKGLVVAGVVASIFSTFDSIGSTLSSLLVRDVYARFLVRDRDDRHYLGVGRALTPVIIFGSFGYIPFLLGERGMLLFFVDLVGAFVVPLLTIYLMGVFTRVHRRGGAVGLSVGVAYGVLRLTARPIAENFGVAILPQWAAGDYAGYIFAVLLTAGSMVVMSLLLGRESPGRLLHEEKTEWLRSSQLQVGHIKPANTPSYSDAWPIGLGVAVVLVGTLLSFVVFW